MTDTIELAKQVCDPCVVWDEGMPERKRYFAGTQENGLPTVFCYGSTAWSSSGTPRWYKHCRPLNQGNAPSMAD